LVAFDSVICVRSGLAYQGSGGSWRGCGSGGSSPHEGCTSNWGANVDL